MKGILLGLLITFSISTFNFAQDYSGKVEKKDGKVYINGLPLFTEEDFEAFEDIPKLSLPGSAKTRNLPEVVDNSARPWFRPIFDQVSLECGQASGVAYTFTYEINRLRDLPSNIIDNQYPTHYVYNWPGGGSGYASSFFDSWNIIKYTGTPNVVEYGGSLSYGGSARWMDGYDLYYSAMHNRLWDFYSIDVTTEEGLLTLKHWIANHLNGEETGGVGNIYTSAIGASLTLPSGTPEGGKHVVLELPAYSNHALCIAGYHDSIRYDLNNDGQYTNDIDINNDGEVNLLDWEIGGVKLANSYYASSWGDAGFAYLLYSGLCRKMNPLGGPWNGMVHVIKAKENSEPQITFKASITHDSRNKIKVMAGVATVPGATEPEFIIDFPILSYQGGDRFMTGGTQEEDKTLEFGLDVTPLLDHVENGETARFFLLVDENDPYNVGIGFINNFSLMDYTFETVEYPCNETNVSLVENGLTMVYVDAEISFEKPEIINEELPPATVNEPYSHQMIGDDGTEPYQWKIKKQYDVQEGTRPFSFINEEQLSPNSWTSGYAAKELDFEFPFYGKTYTTVYMHTDGYLMFKDDNYPWIFLIDQQNLLKNMRNISPMMSKTLQLEGGGSMWYEGNDSKASFRWDSREYSTSNEQNFLVSLYPDGTIEFNYGESTISNYNQWFAGISDGDDFNNMILDISNTEIEPGTLITIEPEYNRTELTISEDGLFQGTPTVPYEGVDVEFYLKDANGMQATKEMLFSTDGANNIVIREVMVEAGDNSIIEYGETATLSLELKNISDTIFEASEMRITTSDIYTTLIDSTQAIEAFGPGETKIIENAFQLEVSDEVPNGQNIVLPTTIEADTSVYNSYIYLEAFTPVLSIGSVEFVDENNGHPEAGETGQFIVNIKNLGGGKAFDVLAELTINDPFITITNGTSTLEYINAGSSANVTFDLEISESTPLGYSTSFYISAVADNNYSASGTIPISVGFIFEDFETGDFSQYEWEFSGNADWTIDTFDPYEGAFCMKSGDIEDDQSSIVSITMDVLLDSEISFYSSVSSESNYDFLVFYIDGTQMASWSGEEGWGLATFNVDAGERTFTWAFEKDYSVSNGLDCGFVDYIIFPPSGELNMAVSAGPDISICEGEDVFPDAFVVNAESMEWSTSGDGTFDDPYILNATYTPGEQDISVGVADLMITAWGIQGDSQTDALTTYIYHMPIVNAGDDETFCENTGSFSLSGVSINSNDYFWFTTGDGTFTNDAALETSYFPGDDDLAAGEVEISLNAYAQAPCEGLTNDEIHIGFMPLPEVTFDELPLLGLNSPPYELTQGEPAGGTYSGPGVSDGWLYPDVAGIGVHTLTYTYMDENGCENFAEQQVTIDEYVNIGEYAEGNIQVVPNPGDGFFTVHLNSNLGKNVVATVYNTSGDVVLKQTFESAGFISRLEIDCSNQPAGIYYLQLNGSQNMATQKLIIK